MTDVYYAMDHILIVGEYCDPNPHKHLMKHLLISLNGKIDCVINEEHISCKGIVISKQVKHTISNKGNKMLLFLFDESTNIATEIEKKYLHDREYRLLEENQLSKVKGIWEEFQLKKHREEEIKEAYTFMYKKILSVCGFDFDKKHITDDRITEILNILHRSDGINKNTLANLANGICLSQSRMSHLFKEETGISLSSCLVYMKLSKAYRYILSGMTVTEASLKAGFNSSSHFASVNKKYLGMSIRYEKKVPLKLIQI